MKTQLITAVLEKEDIKNINSENKEMRNSRIKRDSNDLKKLKSAITSTVNSFKKAIDKIKLFNIQTGFMATEETEKPIKITKNSKFCYQ